MHHFLSYFLLSLAVLQLACLATPDIWVITDISLPRPAQGALMLFFSLQDFSDLYFIFQLPQLNPNLHFNHLALSVSVSWLWAPSLFNSHFQKPFSPKCFLTFPFLAELPPPWLHLHVTFQVCPHHFMILDGVLIHHIHFVQGRDTPCCFVIALLLKVNWAGPRENCEIRKDFAISNLYFPLHFWLIRAFFFSDLLSFRSVIHTANQNMKGSDIGCLYVNEFDHKFFY